MVEKPVVLASTSEEVDVTDETWPLPPVVTMTVETRRVELVMRADVMVVLEVLLATVEEAWLLLPLLPLPDVTATDEVGFDVATEVVAEVSVVLLVMVVGVPFDVEVVVNVAVEEDVMVVLVEAPVDVLSVVEVEAVEPVPRLCLL